MKLLIAIMLVCFSIGCVAEDRYVMHIASYHMKYRDHLKKTNSSNEFNPGFGYINKDYAIGAYLNSEKGISPYALLVTDNEDFFIGYGVVGGYKNYPIAPMVTLNYSFSYYLITVAPGIDSKERLFPVLLFSLQL